MALSKIVKATALAVAIVSAVRVDDDHVAQPKHQAGEEPSEETGPVEGVFPPFQGFDSIKNDGSEGMMGIDMGGGSQDTGAVAWDKIATQGNDQRMLSMLGAGLVNSNQAAGHVIVDADRVTGSITSSMTGYAGDSIAIADSGNLTGTSSQKVEAAAAHAAPPAAGSAAPAAGAAALAQGAAAPAAPAAQGATPASLLQEDETVTEN